MKTKIILLLMCLILTSCGGNVQDDNYGNNNESYNETEETHNITKIDTDSFYGIYMPEDESSIWNYIDIHDDGTWHLYGYDSELTGWFGYDDEYEAEYAYNDADGSGCRFYITDDGRLYFAEYGYFYYTGMDNMWYDNGETSAESENNSISQGGDEYYSWNAELYQRSVSEFEGVWYYDGDLSAETYIVIDGDGNWGYYQRAPGTEAAEMDYGYLTYSDNEPSTYYAVSELYEGVKFKVFEFDQDMLVWDEVGTYYLME